MSRNSGLRVWHQTAKKILKKLPVTTKVRVPLPIRTGGGGDFRNLGSPGAVSLQENAMILLEEKLPAGVLPKPALRRIGGLRHRQKAGLAPGQHCWATPGCVREASAHQPLEKRHKIPARQLSKGFFSNTLLSCTFKTLCMNQTYFDSS